MNVNSDLKSDKESLSSKSFQELHSLEVVHAELHHRLLELTEKAKSKKDDASFTALNQLSHELRLRILEVKAKVESMESDIRTPGSDEYKRRKMMTGDTERKNAELSREHEILYDFFMQAPGLFCVLKGPDFVFELVNPYYKHIIGDRPLKGKSIREALPELKGQGVFELLDKVYKRQRAFTGREIAIYFDKGKGIPEKSYVNFIYKPIIDRNNKTTGILIFGYDVSEQVYSRKRSEENETRLKIAMDASEMGSFEWNMNTREFIYSDRLARIFGQPRKHNMTHKYFVDSIHREDQHLRIHAIEEAMRTGNLFYEARIIRPDKQIRWVKFNGKIVFDRKRNPHKMYGTVLDITDHKTLEDTLERKVKERTIALEAQNELLVKQKELSESVINSSADNIAVFDTQLRYIILNENALLSYKEKAENLIGKQIHKVYPETIKTGMYRDLKRALKGEEVRVFNYRSASLKGFFEISYIPLRDSDNKVYGVLMIAHDNTSIVEASERLISANKKLEDKNAVLERNNKELEAFRYIANHDLQEPLRKIQMFSGLIKKNIPNDSKANDYLKGVANAARSMSDLVAAVLSYSRLSKNDEKTSKVDLNAVLEKVKEELKPFIEEKKGKINSEELLTIKAKPGQIHQLFYCLINNGLKFCDKKPLITISSKNISTDKSHANSRAEKYIELVFKDNGIGFDPKYSEQVFRMFKRLQTSQLYPGAGIGLAMVRKIVENHRGHVFVKSEVSKGTIFYIYLPVQ